MIHVFDYPSKVSYYISFDSDLNKTKKALEDFCHKLIQQALMQLKYHPNGLYITVDTALEEREEIY